MKENKLGKLRLRPLHKNPGLPCYLIIVREWVIIVIRYPSQYYVVTNERRVSCFIATPCVYACANSSNSPNTHSRPFVVIKTQEDGV